MIALSASSANKVTSGSIGSVFLALTDLAASASSARPVDVKYAQMVSSSAMASAKSAASSSIARISSVMSQAALNAKRGTI